MATPRRAAPRGKTRVVTRARSVRALPPQGGPSLLEDRILAVLAVIGFVVLIYMQFKR